MQRGEIIAVGTELLIGGRVDTNSLFLSERLGALGVEVRFKSAVGDDAHDIEQAVRVAVSRAQIILVTGGLGPTSDDRTRQAIAAITRRPLCRSAEAVENLTRRLAAWGRRPTAVQMKQALIPVGAEVLINPLGSAPGFAVRWKGSFIMALPGVPKEAEAMFETAVAPNFKHHDDRIERRVLHTYGLLEADIDRQVGPLVRRSTSVEFGLLASPLGVNVSFTARGLPSRSRTILDRLVLKTARQLGRHVYADADMTMEEVVGRQLAKAGLMLAVAESCTGGLIGHRLTQVPGSSAYFDRGAITYSNTAKHEMLGVPLSLLRRYGAVSPQVAAAMAQGIRSQTSADVGLSVTGIAGPGGGTEQKPVGLVYIGLNAKIDNRSRQYAHTEAFRFHGDRQTIKMRASQAALNMVRLWLLENDG